MCETTKVVTFVFWNLLPGSGRRGEREGKRNRGRRECEREKKKSGRNRDRRAKYRVIDRRQEGGETEKGESERERMKEVVK